MSSSRLKVKIPVVRLERIERHLSLLASGNYSDIHQEYFKMEPKYESSKGKIHQEEQRLAKPLKIRLTADESDQTVNVKDRASLIPSDKTEIFDVEVKIADKVNPKRFTNPNATSKRAQNERILEDVSSSSNKRPSREKEMIFDCVFCEDKTFEDKEGLQFHLETSHLKVSSDFQCCICSLSFAKKIVLILHLRTAHSLDSNEARDIVEEQLSEGIDEHVVVEPTNVENKDSSFEDQDADRMSDINWAPDEDNVIVSDDDDVPLKDVKIKTEVKEEKKSQDPCPLVENFDCKVCQKSSFESIEELTTHYLNVHPKTHVCVICGKIMRRPYNLRRHLKSVHNVKLDRRKTAGNFPCQLCGLKLESSRLFQSHMKDIHEIFCDECGIGLSSKEKLAIHKKTKQCQLASESTELRKKAKTKVCSVCKETFVGVLKLRTHQLTAHDMKPDIPCSLCDEIFFKIIDHSKHLSSVHGLKPGGVSADDQDWSCDICGKKFTRKSNWKRHQEVQHQTEVLETSLLCSDCPKTFQSSTELSRHTKNSHDRGSAGQPLPCPVCGVQYPKATLDKHLTIVHTAEEKSTCDLCNMVFSSVHYLNSHKRRTHGGEEDRRQDGEHVCHVCGKKLGSARDLEIHIKFVHNKEQSFGCDRCGKKFARQRLRDDHVDAVHLKLKKFSCDECDYKSGYESVLRNHKNLKHGAGTRAYKCDQCGREFDTKTIFTLHVRKDHEGLRLKCPICEKEFGVKESLNRHVRAIHQGLKPHKCTGCEMTFALKHSMLRHSKIHGTRICPTEKSNYQRPKMLIGKSRGKGKSKSRKRLNHYQEFEVTDEETDEDISELMCS